MVEPEVAFCEIDGLTELAEDFLKYIFGHVLQNCRRRYAVLQPVVQRGDHQHPRGIS